MALPSIALAGPLGQTHAGEEVAWQQLESSSYPEPEARSTLNPKS